jgi:Spy/CpxP family protein refolding chaperone
VRRAALALVVLTFAVAVLGGWLGVRWGQREVTGHLGLDQVVHQDLSLSPAQQVQIAALETAFTGQRMALEAQMQSANRELAAAIVSDHQMSPAVESAIGHFHEAMRELQEVTTAHVLSMRSVLTPEQAILFDRSVAKALNADTP